MNTHSVFNEYVFVQHYFRMMIFLFDDYENANITIRIKKKKWDQIFLIEFKKSFLKLRATGAV